MSTTGHKVPRKLQEEILAGRCVAFVGAGFSAEAVPGWKELLVGLAGSLRCDDQRTELATAIAGASTAFHYETIGQMLRDGFTTRPTFEEAVVSAVDGAAKRHKMTKRLKWLKGIPFEAILTTNIDGFLPGVPPSPTVYFEVLRQPAHWWERAEWVQQDGQSTSRVVRLHGGVGTAGAHRVVLARSDYRALLYEDRRYADFLRTVLATRTVLFLGVSFTDAYLNEIRSETLALVRPKARWRRPLAYAVLPDLTQAEQKHFLRHEGIEVLGYSTERDEQGKSTTWQGFDDWLRALHDSTSAEARLKAVVHGKTVVWVDAAPDNNRVGIERLRRVEARVELLTDFEDLQQEHHKADLLITHLGYTDGVASSVASKILAKVASWPEHPPVIVFASGKHAKKNRRDVLRRGAFEYAHGWGELFRLIEQLFGRALGR